LGLLLLFPFQTRDTPSRRDPVGTASISGVVVSDGQTPAPLRRAIVSLSGGELARVRSAISDDAGRFTIGNLPAGRYTLKGTKPAYITTEFGSKRAGRPGSAIAIADGQAMTGVTLRMFKGAVISGTIADSTGGAGAGLSVAMFAVPPAGPTHQFTAPPAVVVTTDDRGAYRAFGLLPGPYYVVATAPPSLSVRDMVTSMGDAEVDAALAELQRGRGGSVTGVNPAAPAQAPAAPVAKHGFSGVFYPGTPVPADATVISVSGGEERVGVDFTFAPIPVATISGTVTSPYGPLPSLLIAINPAGVRLESTGSIIPTTWPRLLRDVARGEFMFVNIQPGQYTIAVQSTAAVPMPAAPPSGGRAGQAIPVANSPTLLWAMTDVSVNGSDISGLALNLRPAMRVSGRVVFDGKTTPPPSDLKTLSVNFKSTQSAGRVVLGMTTTVGLPLVPPAQVRADGTFESAGLLPGGYLLLPVPPAGWRLRSAMLDGRDLLDYPFEISADRDLGGVVVTYTDQRTELAGTLQTPAGAPASDYFVVVFPADSNLWRRDSRRVQSVRPASDGHYSVRDLPAGEYLIAALSDFESTDLQDPAFLRALVSAAAKTTLVEGETKRQDLRLVR